MILAGIVAAGRPARCQHPPSRSAARRDRRSLGRPHARMGDVFAAAGLQFRRPAARSRAKKPTGASSSARESRSWLGEEPDYEAIEMPRNSPTGFICAFFATFMGFALIWHIWWLVVVGAARRLRDLRRLRVARRGRIRDSGRRGRAHRSRAAPARHATATAEREAAG